MDQSTNIKLVEVECSARESLIYMKQNVYTVSHALSVSFQICDTTLLLACSIICYMRSSYFEYSSTFCWRNRIGGIIGCIALDLIYRVHITNTPHW